MNREDAYNRIDAIIAKHEIDDEYVTITSALDYDALRMARKALEQEPCEDAISREDALMCLTGELKETDTIETIIARSGRRIRKLPPVNPQPKSGEWIVHEKPHGIRHLECPYCNIWYLNEHLIRNSFCPNCGAKMQEVEK